jgi:transcriptional regulator with XRE-family HTH domain
MTDYIRPGPSRKSSTRPLPQPVRRATRALSEDLVAWRKLRGLTQEQVAERAGISLSTLARLESGVGGASLENLLRVLRALGLLDRVLQSFDPYETDVGRLRAGDQLPQRVRPRDLTGGRGG